MTAPWDAITALGTCVTAIAALAAVLYASKQLVAGHREASEDRGTEEHGRRVERAIAAHRDLTTGEIGAARDRLTTMLWNEGTKRCGRNLCWVPTTFGELLPPDGSLATYPPTVVGGHQSEPMRDLFKVLWCFERIEAALASEAIDEELLRALAGHHLAWWATLTRNILETDVTSRGALERLSAWIEKADRVHGSGMMATAEADFPSAEEAARLTS